jgi:hypothetical protein
MDDDKCKRVRLAQELVECLSVAAEDELHLLAPGKRPRLSACRYATGRKPVLVAHVRLAPDQRAGERRIVRRRQCPDVEAERCRDEQSEDAAPDQQRATTPRHLHRVGRGKR